MALQTRSHLTLLREDGSVEAYCTYEGDLSAKNLSSILPTDNKGFVTIANSHACGPTHITVTAYSCAARADGTTECWVPTDCYWDHNPAPVKERAAPQGFVFEQLTAAPTHACGLVKGSGVVECWGYEGSDPQLIDVPKDLPPSSFVIAERVATCCYEREAGVLGHRPTNGAWVQRLRQRSCL